MRMGFGKLGLELMIGVLLTQCHARLLLLQLLPPVKRARDTDAAKCCISAGIEIVYKQREGHHPVDMMKVSGSVKRLLHCLCRTTCALKRPLPRSYLPPLMKFTMLSGLPCCERACAQVRCRKNLVIPQTALKLPKASLRFNSKPDPCKSDFISTIFHSPAVRAAPVLSRSLCSILSDSIHRHWLKWKTSRTAASSGVKMFRQILCSVQDLFFRWVHESRPGRGSSSS